MPQGSDNDERSMEERLLALESAVAKLQTGLLALHDVVRHQQTGASVPPSDAPTAIGLKTPSQKMHARHASSSRRSSTREIHEFDAALKSGDWLNRVGVALLLVGVAFLFKYASDHGWITPETRVGFGLVLGTVLILLGARLRTNRSRYALVLTGGGIASLYMTVFAAFSLYGLWSYSLAFAGMVAVTVGSFALALRDGAPSHALIGTVGGLVTPFLLYTPNSSVSGLIAYTCTILIGATAVYLARGWRTLILVAAVGGWIIFVIAIVDVDRPAGTDHWAVQLGIGVAAVFTWCGTAFRERVSPIGVEQPWRQVHYQLIAATPFIALILSAWLWDWNEREGAIACFALAVVWTVMAYALRGEVGFAHVVVAVALATVGLVLWLDGDMEILALGAEALALHIAAHRLGKRALGIGGHALSLVVIVLLSFRLMNSPGGASAIIDLALIAFFALAVRFVSPRTLAPLYLLAALGLWLVWLYRGLDPLANGQAFVSASWITTGAVLLIIGLLRDQVRLRQAAGATFVAAIAKLFLVDLATVEMIWRSFVFMGFGAVLLALGYLFPSLWRRTDPS